MRNARERELGRRVPPAEPTTPAFTVIARSIIARGQGNFNLETAVEFAPCCEVALAQRIGKNGAVTIWGSAV